MSGIGDRKPAKDFSKVERGKYRHVYCRRKLVWTALSAMLDMDIPLKKNVIVSIRRMDMISVLLV
jgi:hypothetical protein